MLEIKIYCDVCGASASMKDYKQINGWESLGFDKHLCPECVEKWGKKNEETSTSN